MSLKVRVEGEPHGSLKKSQAKDLIRRGLAEWVKRNGTIRYLAPAQSSPLRSGQGRVYERAATDPRPVILNGGLTRNEHQPAKHQPFKAARVGH